LAGAAPSLTAPLSGIFLRTLMLGHGWEGAGIWQAAARIPDLVYPMWNGVVGAWVLSRVAGAEGTKGLRGSIVLQAFAGTCALSLVLCAGALPILHLAWGEGFEQATPLLRLQALAELPRTLTWILVAALLGRGRTGAVVLLELLGFTILCGGTYLLQPRFGLAAPALASILDNLTCLGLATVLWAREKRRT
jgi:O-antigen/teichoic acid export membrane protein